MFVISGVLFVAESARAGYSLEAVGTFSSPIFVTSEPDDPDRLLVVEQNGTIKLVDHGAISTFLEFPPGSLSTGGERGLFSVALDPGYESNGRLYVYYTLPGPPDEPTTLGDLQIDEFTASGDSVEFSTRRPLLTVDHPVYGNHNGGQLQFGPDGYLYIATGDGGGGGDPDGNGQDLESLLGKLLRIDPDPGPTRPYTVPIGNPFVGAGTARPEIWSYGLRNPFRFSFDSVTGALAIGDVGQAEREEVDYWAAPQAGRGANFGWNCREGLITYSGAPGSCTGLTGYTDPIYDYRHALGRCSIAGGYVARDPGVADLYGRYVFGDLCTGEVFSLDPSQPPATDAARIEPVTVGVPSSFGEDSCGRLYVASLQTGAVSRFTGSTAGCSLAAASPPATSGPPDPEAGLRKCGGANPTIDADGTDEVRGTSGRDVILGSTGVDVIRARGGHDLICARAGDDNIDGGPGRDRIRAGRGRDRCNAGRADHIRSC